MESYSKTPFTRSIDEVGRIVLPATYREALGLREGDQVDIYLEDGRLVLCPHGAPEAEGREEA